MPLVRSTEYEPPGASRNIESPEYEHPRMSWQGFFWKGNMGGPQIQSNPESGINTTCTEWCSQITLRYGWNLFSKKRTNSTLHNPFCRSFFSAYVFLGPWLYNTCFSKTTHFLRVGSWFFFSLLAPPRWKDFIHVFFSIFQFLMYCKHVGSV